MGVLKVRVNGVWEDVSAAGEPPLDEVWVGAGPPDPVGTYELWVDNTVVPPILHFKDASGAWDVVSGDEVHVGVEDPYVINPEAHTELWHDTSIGQAGKLKARWGGQWHPVADFNESEVEIGPTDPIDHGIPAGTTELWVDTSTTPVVLKAWVNGGWVDAGSASTGVVPEEVNVGPVDPRDATVELWYDTSVTPGTLKANNNGVWEEVGGADEVVVGNTDPYVTDPASEIELWYDTSKGVPGTLYVRSGGQWVAIQRYGGIAYSQYYGQEPFVGTQNEAARSDHVHGTPPEEVVVGDDDPAIDNPEIELWYDTTASVVTTTDARVLTQRIVALEGRLALLERRLVQAGDVLDGPN